MAACRSVGWIRATAGVPRSSISGYVIVALYLSEYSLLLAVLAGHACKRTDTAATACRPAQLGLTMVTEQLKLSFRGMPTPKVVNCYLGNER